MTHGSMEALREAARDIAAGVGAHRVWMRHAWLDIRIRYRRSTLGPFWITINIAVMVLALGLLYSTLFRVDPAAFIPYFAAGIVAWNLFSGFLMDATGAFVSAEHLIRQIRLPLSVHIMRSLARNIIVFAHNAAVVAASVAILGGGFTWRLVLLPFSLLLLTAIFFFLALAVAMLSTRFRDTTQIVASLLQVIMLFTPIFWMRGVVPEGMEYLYLLNPFHHFVELLRCPFLGEPMRAGSLVFSGVCLLVSAAATVPLYARYRGRISYWL